MATSPEGVKTARSLAEAFERDSVSAFDRCLQVNVLVYTAPARDVYVGLEDGWRTSI